MDHLALSATFVIAALAVFLICVSALGYALPNHFVRARLIMTLFFFFIVATLTAAFWPLAFASLPFVVPAAIVGALVGYVAGVKTAQEKLMMQGIERYMEHVAHVHLSDIAALRWWSVVNFYSIGGALLLVNAVGLSTVIFAGRSSWALATCTLGAFLIGTLAPYLIHLWSISTAQNAKRTTSEI